MTDPLAGYRVIVLRAVEQSYELEKTLSSLGADVILCPMIQFEKIPSSSSKVSYPFLQRFNTLIFTSANGVKFFMQALFQNGYDVEGLADKRLIVVGPQTAATLKSYGLTPTLIAKKFAAEGIADLFKKEIKEENILILTAFDARKDLPDTLAKRGAHVVVLKLYKTTRPEIKEVYINDGDLVLFTSSSTAQHFFESSLYTGQEIFSFCIGDITRATVMEYTVDRVHVSKEAVSQSMVESILEFTSIS